ncbi:MAG: hypothetical protein R2699_13715 [Acidimicrobiales bacterium]|nr:hypothetical protein [Acidimicrobiales bacterium]
MTTARGSGRHQAAGDGTRAAWSRRRALGVLGAVGGAAWVAPQVLSIDAAAAASPPPTPGLQPGWLAQHTLAGSCSGITANYQPYTPNSTATSWSTLPRSCGSLLVRTMYGIGSNGSGTVIAVGDQNFRVRWTGSGATMANDSQAFGGSLNTYNDISASGTTWVAVGNSGRIRRSTDDGVTFSSPSSQPGGAPALTFIRHAHGTWLCGGGTIGLLWRSTDGGATWTSVSIGGTSAIWQDVCYVRSTSTWLVCGTLGEIWASVDDGLTWTLRHDSGADSWTGIDANHGIVVACAAGLGRLVRSTDGGATFSVTTIGGGSPAFNDIKAGPDDEWMVVGLANEIWWSDDNAGTWTAASGLPSLRTWNAVTHAASAD